MANFTPPLSPGVGMERKAAKLLLQRAAISSRKICEAEENVIETDCFPQPRVVGPSKSGVVKGRAYKSQAECAFSSLLATGEQRLFLPAYATQNIQGEDLFPTSATYHITCTQ